MIKKRKAKNSDRGIYLQDTELQQTNFQVGSHFKYVIDRQTKRIVILPATGGKNTVSKRATKKGVKPVIDIRSKEALQVFQGADYLQVEIEQDQIVVSGFQEQRGAIAEKIIGFKRLTSKQKKVIDITSILDAKKKCEVRFSMKDLEQVVGQSYQQVPLSFHGTTFEQNTFEHQFISQASKIPLQVISLFSGAGVMDWGFIEEGFDIQFALELEKAACETYRMNIGNHIVQEDITRFNKECFSELGAPVMIGGSPCQGFSNSNRYTNFLDNPNNLLVREFIESVKSNPNCKIFILENVPQLLTAGEGRFLEEILQELSDFEHSYGVLSSAQFGEAQDRKRSILIGSRIGKIDLPCPTHTPDQYTTVRKAFEGLHDDVPNQMDFSIPKSDTLKRMKYVPEGGNWREIPKNLLPKGMQKGKSHSSVFKRLEWDKPSITITNVRKSNILHPSENRVLSVRECARLFGLPDHFIFKGKLSEKQQQIANSVPVKLSRAIANVVKTAIMQFNIRNRTATFGLV